MVNEVPANKRLYKVPPIIFTQSLKALHTSTLQKGLTKIKPSTGGSAIRPNFSLKSCLILVAQSTTIGVVSQPKQTISFSFTSTNMAAEPWKDDEKSSGYSGLICNQRHLPRSTIKTLQEQRPWRSTIRFTKKRKDFYDVHSYNIDCLLVVVRMLMSLGLRPKPKYRQTAIMTCTAHDFGWDRHADFRAKGILVQKLFPELLDCVQRDSVAVWPKPSIENLMNHPGVYGFIFAYRDFRFRYYQLPINAPSSEIAAHSEPVKSNSSQVPEISGRRLSNTMMIPSS